MERASRVMYSIANFFTWITAFCCIAGIVLSILQITQVININTGSNDYGVASLVAFIFFLIVALVTIAMVRRAKAKNSSKAWDVLFLILGIVGWNIFYILGGIFGIVAVRD